MKRIYSLDVLRVVATICIVFHHYQQITGAFFEGGLNFFGGRFGFGMVVEFFFVLSGFLAYRYVENLEKLGDFKTFIRHKIIRLLPLMAISGVIYEVFLLLYNHICKTPWMLGNNLTVWGTIINALGIQSGWAFQNGLVNNPAWYVSDLLLCYIVFYFLLYLSRKKDIPVMYLFTGMVFLGAGIVTYGIELPFMNIYTSKGYYAFFFGLILGRFLYNREITAKMAVVSLLIAVLVPYGLVNHFYYFEQGLIYLMAFVYYPALIILFLSKPVKRIFDYRLFGALGEITYDVYIWHVPMMLLMYVIFELLAVNVNVQSAVVMMLFAVSMFGVGTVSHYLLDLPLRKKLDMKFEKKV